MFRLLRFVALMAPLFGFVHAQDTGAFDWDITPLDSYPQIAFDGANAESEVIFMYNYTGTLVDNSKYLTVQLFQFNCIDPADASLNVKETLMDGSNELRLDLDIVQATITNSVHYAADGETAADITFCVRVDYYYKDDAGEAMSINFHETTVDISVDLTANFTLTGISTDRTAADLDEARAQLDYPIHAYFCDDTSTEIVPDPYVQGSILQVCVEIDDSVEADVYVVDILRFVVSQPLGPGTESVNINDGEADPLTLKTCRQVDGGVCNVKTQLPSKYFVNPNPNDLQIDGMALLAFGIPTLATGARKLRLVHIRGTIAAPSHPEEDAALQRRLQEGGENPFSLEVGLVSDATPTAQPVPPPVEEEAPDYTMLLAVLVVMILVLICTCILACVVCFCCANKKQRDDEERKRINQYEEEQIRRYAEKMGMVGNGSASVCGSDATPSECAPLPPQIT